MPQLRIVVLVKQVPDTANVTGEAMKEDGTINRSALPAVFNPEDLNALEEALKLKDTGFPETEALQARSEPGFAVHVEAARLLQPVLAALF